MKRKPSSCIVCDQVNWLKLPHSTHGKSVRSDGAILEVSLNKGQCKHCGLVQTLEAPDVASLIRLYTDEYDIYANRPESEQFVGGRYRALAHAITASVFPYRPRRFLEVGCGNGSALRAVQALWKEADGVGMEPVTTAVKMAQNSKLNVHQGIVGGCIPNIVGKEKYDVIYSIHVIEHTQNPVDFLNGLKKLLTPHGRLIITCPNARVPNLEIMRTDHNFSMTPYHLEILARKAGLLPLKSTLCPGGGEDLDYEHNQLLVCCLPPEDGDVGIDIPLPEYLSSSNQMRLFGERTKYFQDFEELDERLDERTDGAVNLYCFGTGGWTCMLAGYAPKTWEKIKACVVDGGSESKFHGKSIVAYNKLKSCNPDGIVIGVNPITQPMIAQRLEEDGHKYLYQWNDIISV